VDSQLAHRLTPMVSGEESFRSQFFKEIKEICLNLQSSVSSFEGGLDRLCAEVLSASLDLLKE